MVRIIMNNVAAWDSAVSIRIFRLSGRKIMDTIMYWSSRIGDGYIYAVIALFLFVLDLSIAPRFLLAGVLSFILEVTIQVMLKNKFKRKRPFDKLLQIKFLVKPPDKFSFPSGHTAAAFLMAVLISHFYPVFTIPVFLIASVIGFSRIYNGLHFPSDVLAGLILGVFCAQFGLLII